MTTRDPRSRVPQRPPATGRGASREPTQSLSHDPALDDDEHPSLAVGTSDAVRERRDRTKVESPSGRLKAPTRPPSAPPHGDEPEQRIGSVLGAYKLLELLGKGGMGYVYRAEHVKLEREVALKLLRADYAKRRDAVVRFFQEARTVNRVRHRNIVDVTDFVELEDGTTFIIMELLSGQSLSKWVRSEVDLPRALAVLVQICDGLGAAHAVGVVHRDLKPDNVIIVPTSDGAELVKLLDFGVAKLVNRDDEDIGFQTAAGSVIGTPAYMSPEQSGGMLVDHRSDIYSLGAIMYELFCGQPMFRGRSFGEYVRKHLTEVPVPPSQTKNGATIQPALEALILKCLAKDPTDRFAHVLELRDGLLHLLGSIETHPPSYATPTTGPAQPLPRRSLPLPAPEMATTVATAPHLSGIVHRPTMPTPQVPPPAPAEVSVPLWIWVVGGACAVSIGVAGALWYAKPSDTKPIDAPLPSVVTQPATSAPIQPGALQARLIELKFDSLPSGGVYADGRSAELCRTPCNFNVDLADGGPTNRRTFVVRSEGYEDMPVDVDFSTGQRDYAVTLVRIQPAGVPPIVDMTQVDPGHKRKGSPADRKKAEDAKPAQSPQPEPKPPAGDDTKLEQSEKSDEPAPSPKAPKKQPGRIDPSDTIDPFRTK